LNSTKSKNSEVVVVSFMDPETRDVTMAGAKTLTQKQAETVVEFLRVQGVHKMGWGAWSRRKVTALGMGTASSPVVEKAPLPPSNTQILLYIPRE